MVLAHLGCEVEALERVPALVMLVLDAIEESALAARLRVVATDAVAWLQGLSQQQRPAVVYLDPMFSESGSAQVKKDMQVCRALAGPPDDPLPLFLAARRAARERVVVKRHRDLAPIAEGVSFAVAGSRVRFDVYLATAGGGGTVSETRAR
jgi:16S rRNA (guanine1516-N2)-methyltransferase